MIFEIHLFTLRTTERLLQKVQSLRDAPEGNMMHVVVAKFEFEDQGKL